MPRQFQGSYTTETNYLTEDGVIAPVHVRKELAIAGVHDINDGASREGSTGEKTSSVTADAEKV